MVIKEATEGETVPSSTVTAAKGSDKTVIIAQEIKFARALAGNDPKLRRKVLKNLKTWLATRSQSTFAFSDADFLRLWKGLFYCMWMSDKPLVQEELAESVGSLVRCFEHDVPVALQFFKAFIVTMGIEWFGIDRWRMDKFMMLVRRVTRQMLFVLHGNEWDAEHVALLVQTIEATVLDNDVCPFGLTNHFNDVLLEEIAKVSDGEVPKEVVTQFVEPYVRYLLKNDDTTVNRGVVKNIFHALMQQSDLGQMYEEKFDIWKRSNFVTGDIDNVEFNVEYQYEDEENDDEGGEAGGENGEADEDEDEELEEENGDKAAHREEEDGGGENEEGTGKVYDPRAGRVSVEIPQIEFDPLEIIALFEKYRYKPYVTSQGKKSAILLVRQLNKFATGAYPLGIKNVPSIHPKDYAVDVEAQVEDLELFRKELYGDKKLKNGKELKKEKRQQRKLFREQKAAQMKQQQAAGAQPPNGATATCTEEDGRPSVADGEVKEDENTTTQEQDESDAAASGLGEKKSTLKRKKLRRQNPALQKKKMKLELLNAKKQEKLLLLKQRLQEKRSASLTNGRADASDTSKEHSPPSSSDAAELPSSSPSTKVKQPKPAAKQEEEAEATSPVKKQRTKEKVAPKKSTNSKPFETADEWSTPLQEGEEEYFIPSRKLKTLSKAKPPVASPVAAPVTVAASKPLSLKRTPPPADASDADPITPARKRVKIALNKNVAQDLVEHIEQVKSSPKLPFDSSRKPSKSLLKPNLIPSPINPFYKKKIGLK